MPGRRLTEKHSIPCAMQSMVFVTLLAGCRPESAAHLYVRECSADGHRKAALFVNQPRLVRPGEIVVKSPLQVGARFRLISG